MAPCPDIEPEDLTAGQVEAGVVKPRARGYVKGDTETIGESHDTNAVFSYEQGKAHGTISAPPAPAPGVDLGQYWEGYNEGVGKNLRDGIISPNRARELLTMWDKDGTPIPAQPSSGEVRTVSSTGGEKGAKPQRYDLIPIGPLNLLAELYGKGAEKYAEHNFRKGYNWSLSYAAAMRHLTAFWNGEDIDPEMGLPHVICAAFHMFALAEFMKEHPEFDDRYIRALKEALPEFPTEPSVGPYYPN